MASHASTVAGGGTPSRKPTSALSWLFTPQDRPEVETEREQTHILVWLLLLVVVVWAAVRIFDGWGTWFVGGDEGVYYMMAASAPDRAAAMIEGNAHPPLYPYALRAMAAVSTDMDFLRVHAALAALLLLPAVFFLGRLLAGSAAGLAAALLMAGSPGVITLAAVMRPYTVHLLLLVTALYMLSKALRLWDDEQVRSRWRLWAYAALMSLALLVHYSTIAVLGGVGLFCIVSLLRKRLAAHQVRDLILVHAAISVLGAYLYITHISQIQGSSMQAEAQSGWLKTQFVGSAEQAWLAIRAFSGYAFGGIKFVVLGAALALPFVTRDRTARAFSFVMYATLLVALILSVLKQYPVGGSRHSLYLAALVAPAAAATVGSLIAGRRGIQVVAGLLLFGAMAVGFVKHEFPLGLLPERTISNETAQAIRDYRESAIKAGDLVLVDQQTYYAVWPMIKDRGSPQAIPNTEAYALDIDGGYDMVMLRAWYLVGVPSERDAHNSLYTHLAALEAAGGAYAPANRRIWVIQGGWGVPLAERLPEATADGTRIRSEVVGGPSLRMMQIDLAGYRKYARSAD